MMLCQKKIRRIQRHQPNCSKLRVHEGFIYKRIKRQQRVQRIKQHHGFVKPCTEYRRIKLQNQPPNWAEGSMKPSKKKQRFQPQPPLQQQPDWAMIPTDVLSVIFNKLGSVGVLVSAQRVCRTWRQLSLNAGEHFWRSVDMRRLSWPTFRRVNHEKLAMAAIDRSGGHVEELHVKRNSDDFLTYIAERTPKLRRAALTNHMDVSPEVLLHFLRQCPLLEELHINRFVFSHKTYGDIGLACPNLKRLLIDWRYYSKSNFSYHTNSDTKYIPMKERHYLGIGCCEYPNNSSGTHVMAELELELSHDDKVVMEIANNMPQLRELHLLDSSQLTSKGLHAILDKCLRLEFLYVHHVGHIRVDNAFLAKLAKIKSVRLNRKSKLPKAWWRGCESFGSRPQHKLSN